MKSLFSVINESIINESAVQDLNKMVEKYAAYNGGFINYLPSLQKKYSGQEGISVEKKITHNTKTFTEYRVCFYDGTGAYVCIKWYDDNAYYYVSSGNTAKLYPDAKYLQNVSKNKFATTQHFICTGKDILCEDFIAFFHDRLNDSATQNLLKELRKTRGAAKAIATRLYDEITQD